MIDDAMNERLTAYLLGELPPAEAAELESRLATDPALRAEADELRQTIDLAETVALAEIAADSGAIDAAAQPDPTMPRGRFRLPARLSAAAVLLLATVGFGYVARTSRSAPAGDDGASHSPSELADTGRDLQTQVADIHRRIDALDVKDFDVEIAQGAAIIDPIIRTLTVSEAPDFRGARGLNPGIVELLEEASTAAAHGGRRQAGDDGRSDPVTRFNSPRFRTDGARSPNNPGDTPVPTSQSPANGLFYNNDARNDLRGRTERIFDSVLGTALLDDIGAEAYELPPENAFVRALGREALSTFSVDVDTAAYANVRRFLDQGALPPPEAVRIEEFVNAFRYRDEPPTDGRPLVARAAEIECPWAPKHRLLRVTLKARELELAKRPRMNLVFLLDVSGSMDDPKKLPLVTRSMRLLADQLGENDKLSIVVYAGSSGVVLPPTNGDRRVDIRAALDRLKAGGSTNGGEGIELAYKIARENFVENGVNRVVLCTDGDFNVGVTDRSALLDLIAERARSNVFLTVLGFGYGNLKDATLEQLADKGNGNYGYVDDDREARKLLVEGFSGTLVTVAKDVKLQVEFNPQRVFAYRLIGYENRLMAAQDFRNDAKDAGEVGAGHVVTALYEIVPNEPGAELPTTLRPLKYQPTAAEQVAATPEAGAQAGAVAKTPDASAKAPTSDELCTVHLRYKEPEGTTAVEVETPVKIGVKPLGTAANDLRFAAAVAMFGMKLRGSSHGGLTTWPLIEELAQEAAGNVDDRGWKDPSGERAEFVALVRKAMQLRPR